MIQTLCFEVVKDFGQYHIFSCLQIHQNMLNIV